jgi:hypothetical protein
MSGTTEIEGNARRRRGAAIGVAAVLVGLAATAVIYLGLLFP